MNVRVDLRPKTSYQTFFNECALAVAGTLLNNLSWKIGYDGAKVGKAV